MKTILVSLNDLDRAPATATAAVALAKAHDAHLIGQFVVPALRVYPVVGIQLPPEVLTRHRRRIAAQGREVEEMFHKARAAEGVRGEWLQTDSASPLIADDVIAHARRADLVIAAQPSGREDALIERDFAERLVLESGRPVLFIPRAGEYGDFGHRVVVGWNARREATRAVHDALPLLAVAREVRLAWVDPQDEPETAGDLAGAELAGALARHGVNAVVDTVVSGSLEAGEVLLNHVADSGADMLVMGAWGHSRLREYVFGGATAHVMRHMTVPTLFSH